MFVIFLFFFNNLEKGGTPPKFLLLDDGYKYVEMDSNAKSPPVGNTMK